MVVTGVRLLGQLLWPAFFVPIYYWAGALCDDAAVFVLVCLLVCLNVAVFHGFGTLIVACFPSRALTALLTMMTFIFSFTGLFKPLDETPLPWLKFANPVCYTITLMIRLLFQPGRTYAADGGGPRLTHDDALEMYPTALPEVSSPLCVVVLIAVALATRVGACLVLARRMHRVLHTQLSAAVPPPSKWSRLRERYCGMLGARAHAVPQGMLGVDSGRDEANGGASAQPGKPVQVQAVQVEAC